MVAGDAAVRLSGRERCSRTDSSNTAGDGARERAQLCVTAARCSSFLARCPVGHLSVLDLGSTQTANSRPATGPESAPAGRGTVSDIARADGDRASLRIVEMRSQHSTISRRKFGPTRDADDHNPVGENRRLLWLIGQRVYATKPDEQRAQRQEQDHPTPGSTWASLIRLVRNRATNRVALRRLSDAG